MKCDICTNEVSPNPYGITLCVECSKEKRIDRDTIIEALESIININPIYDDCDDLCDAIYDMKDIAEKLLNQIKEN
jgi:hypothetical protein